jgi:hypothetical protein
VYAHGFLSVSEPPSPVLEHTSRMLLLAGWCVVNRQSAKRTHKHVHREVPPLEMHSPWSSFVCARRAMTYSDDASIIPEPMLAIQRVETQLAALIRRLRIHMFYHHSTLLQSLHP